MEPTHGSKRFGNYRNARTVGMYDVPQVPIKLVDRARQLTTDELRAAIYAAGRNAFERSRRGEFVLPPPEEIDS